LNKPALESLIAMLPWFLILVGCVAMMFADVLSRWLFAFLVGIRAYARAVWYDCYGSPGYGKRPLEPAPPIATIKPVIDYKKDLENAIRDFVDVLSRLDEEVLKRIEKIENECEGAIVALMFPSFSRVYTRYKAYDLRCQADQKIKNTTPNAIAHEYLSKIDQAMDQLLEAQRGWYEAADYVRV
jgi:hypothetical protein